MRSRARILFLVLAVLGFLRVDKALADALLAANRTGINATGDIVINETLLPGFRLSGAVDGPGFPGAVIVRSGSAQYYAGRVNQSKRYTAVVPAGTYALTACFGLPSGSGEDSTYEVPESVEVSGDTTKDITLPSIPVFSVSGNVSGLGNLPAMVLEAKLVFMASDQKHQASFRLDPTGSYQGVLLPSGTYNVSLSAGILLLPTGDVELMTIHNLGSVTVSESATTANFTVPSTALLSGAVSFQGTPMSPPGTTISMTDMTVPPPAASACAQPSLTSLDIFDTISGSYQMLLAKDRSYSPKIHIPVIVGSQIIGTANYPATATSFLLGGDETRNFDVPKPPDVVTISGRVTDESGRGVFEVVVAAFSEELTGVPDVSFAGATTSDENGNYSLPVLRGVNYQLIFAPPPPQ